MTAPAGLRRYQDGSILLRGHHPIITSHKGVSIKIQAAALSPRRNHKGHGGTPEDTEKTNAGGNNLSVEPLDLGEGEAPLVNSDRRAENVTEICHFLADLFAHVKRILWEGQRNDCANAKKWEDLLSALEGIQGLPTKSLCIFRFKLADDGMTLLMLPLEYCSEVAPPGGATFALTNPVSPAEAAITSQ